MIYKDQDHIVYSCEKDEGMQKLDDSEFKLPNETHSKHAQCALLTPRANCV